MMKLVLLAVIAMASAQDITVCRSGQTITIPVSSLSPYDELGNCRVSDYIVLPTTSPTSAPAVSSFNPDPPATAPPAMTTGAPVATPAPTTTSTSMPSAAPTSGPITTMPLATATPATLGPNAIIPDNAVTPPPMVLPAGVPLQQTANPGAVIAQPAIAEIPLTLATLPPNDMPIATHSIMEPIGQNATAPVAHHDHEDAHEWQATGSFSHGHMHAVVKANNRVLPNNLEPNDPKTRVLVFLQWFSPESVYDHPQQVFMFFTKPLDVHSQRAMRIN